MARIPLKKVVTDNKEVNQLQEFIKQGTQALRLSPCGDYNIVDGVLLDGQNWKTVNTGLGRDALGWFVVRLKVNATSSAVGPYVMPQLLEITPSTTTNTITFACPTACTASIMFW